MIDFVESGICLSLARSCVLERIARKGNYVIADKLTLTCDLDCTYVAQLYRLPGKLLVTRRGRAVGGHATVLPLRVPSTKASYRLRLSVVAVDNPGRATLKLVSLRPG